MRGASPCQFSPCQASPSNASPSKSSPSNASPSNASPSNASLERLSLERLSLERFALEDLAFEQLVLEGLAEGHRLEGLALADEGELALVVPLAAGRAAAAAAGQFALLRRSVAGGRVACALRRGLAAALGRRAAGSAGAGGPERRLGRRPHDPVDRQILPRLEAAHRVAGRRIQESGDRQGQAESTVEAALRPARQLARPLASDDGGGDAVDPGRSRIGPPGRANEGRPECRRLDSRRPARGMRDPHPESRRPRGSRRLCKGGRPAGLVRARPPPGRRPGRDAADFALLVELGQPFALALRLAQEGDRLELIDGGHGATSSGAAASPCGRAGFRRERAAGKGTRRRRVSGRAGARAACAGARRAA